MGSKARRPDRSTAGRGKRLGLIEFVALFATMTALTAMSIDTMLPALPVIGGDLGVADLRDTQLIISVLILGMVGGELFAGPISDAVGRKPVILGGIVIFCAGSAVAMTAQGLEMMLIGRFIQGMGVSGPKIASRAMIRDQYSGDAMARIVSLIMMIFILVPMVAPAIGQVIMIHADWRMIFAIFILVSVGAGLWMFTRQQETLVPERRHAFRPVSVLRRTGALFGHQVVLAYTAASGLMFGSILLFLSTAQAMFLDMYDIGELFPLYFAVLASGIALAGFVNSALVMRHGARKISLLALSGMTVISLTLILVSWRVGGIPTFWTFMVAVFAVFFCLGCLFGNLNALAMRPLGEMAGLGASFIAAVSSLIAFAFGAGLGRLYDGTVLPLAFSFAVAGILGLILVRLVRDRTEPPKSGKAIPEEDLQPGL